MRLGPRRFILFGACALATACVDPRASYESFEPIFVEAAQCSLDGAPETPEDCRTPHPDEINGNWLLSIGTPQASPKPMVALLNIDAKPAGNGVLEIVLDAQPLDARDRVTQVGKKLPPATVFAETSFVIEIGREVNDGRSNPLIYGTDTESEITLCGTVCSVRDPGDQTDESKIDQLCGIGAGKIYKPIELSLDGTTFSAHRIKDPLNYPTDLDVDCEGTPAEDVQ